MTNLRGGVIFARICNGICIVTRRTRRGCMPFLSCACAFNIYNTKWDGVNSPVYHTFYFYALCCLLRPITLPEKWLEFENYWKALAWLHCLHHITHTKCKVLLPGQDWVLQSINSSMSPTQFLPHVLGGGALHERVLFCRPPPHVLLHWPQEDQAEKLPFTG